MDKRTGWVIAGLVLACLLLAGGTGAWPFALAGAGFELVAGLAGGLAGLVFGLIGLVIGLLVAGLALVFAGPAVLIVVLLALLGAALAVLVVLLLVAVPVLLPLGLLVGLVWLVARAARTPPPPVPARSLPAPR